MAQLKRTRAGWDAERLAEYLLARIAFVARPTSIADDIGIDFQCTLFHELPGEHPQLIPALPFAVQVKSSFERLSLTKFLPLLLNTPLPFMVAVSNRDRGRITLYSGRFIRYALGLYGPKPLSLVAFPVGRAADVRSAVRCTRREGPRRRPRVQVDMPRIADYGVGTAPRTLERIRGTLEVEVRQVALNSYNTAVGQHLFRFPRPSPRTRVLTGSGSVTQFRASMADRLDEYARNLHWLVRRGGESHAEEMAAFLGAADLLRPFVPQPDHLRRAIRALRSLHSSG